MKKTKLFTILAASALVLSACSKDEPNTGTIDEGNGKPLTELNGSIEKDVTLAPEVSLKGQTIVRAGATLTIPAGTKITANAAGTGVYLLIERGAKIIAEGTADKPIVFTSAASQPKAGDWGGLLINGNAPLYGNETGKTEINTGILYGGDKVDDNSGVLKFVKIEYTGAKIDDESEHNGLTLNGVGSGTTISDIFIREGADDGIEFFGGSVNVTNLLVVNSQDDMFDCTQGYQGTWKNFYGIWETNYQSSSTDASGIESDGNLDGISPSQTGQSNFKVQDMSIVNKSKMEMKTAIKVRRGATTTISNLLIQGDVATQFADFINFSDTKGTGNAASNINYYVNPVSIFSAGKIKAEGATVTQSAAALQGANTSVFAWTGYQF